VLFQDIWDCALFSAGTVVFSCEYSAVRVGAVAGVGVGVDVGVAVDVGVVENTNLHTCACMYESMCSICICVHIPVLVGAQKSLPSSITCFLVRI